MKKGLLIVVGVLVLIALYVGTSYNSLISANEKADAQWATVETQYQRRFDLIPALVNSVKGILTQEQTVFQNIADARTKYAGASTPDTKASAASEVETSLGRLLVIIENYPDLKSSVNMQDLMSQLEGSENRISVERTRFNDTVRDYNLSIKRVPKSIIASIFGFNERAYFEAQEGTDVAPTVQF